MLMDGVRVDGLLRSIHTAEVCLLAGAKGSFASRVYKLAIIADRELW